MLRRLLLMKAFPRKVDRGLLALRLTAALPLFLKGQRGIGDGCLSVHSFRRTSTTRGMFIRGATKRLK